MSSPVLQYRLYEQIPLKIHHPANEVIIELELQFRSSLFCSWQIPCVGQLHCNSVKKLLDLTRVYTTPLAFLEVTDLYFFLNFQICRTYLLFFPLQNLVSSMAKNLQWLMLLPHRLCCSSFILLLNLHTIDSHIHWEKSAHLVKQMCSMCMFKCNLKCPF